MIKFLFLDTNVILTGAFDGAGVARRFVEFSGKIKFITSQRVIDECRYNIRKKSQNNAQLKVLESALSGYIQALRCVVVTDSYPQGIKNSRENDGYILETALAHKCDAICTYNLADFTDERIDAISPESAIRRFSHELDARNYLEPTYLGYRGTLLFMGKLFYEGALGGILISDSGVKVILTEDGFVSIDGPDIEFSSQFSPIMAGDCVLTFRYNETDFHADAWEKTGDVWNRVRLSSAKCRIGPVVRSLINAPGNFRGTVLIQNISGVPQYVKDKKLPGCFDAKSLNVRFGSTSMQHVVDGLASRMT